MILEKLGRVSIADISEIKWTGEGFCKEEENIALEKENIAMTKSWNQPSFITVKMTKIANKNY